MVYEYPDLDDRETVCASQLSDALPLGHMVAPPYCRLNSR